MRRTEIKIKRHDLMSVTNVAALLRRIADQLEGEHVFRLDEYPITLANYVDVHQKFEKKGRENLYKLTVKWEEELVDQTKLDDETGEEHSEDDDDLRDETGLPSTPLDLPGTDGEQPRLGGE